jgi:long-chain acyl-CoA synthetase
VNIYPAEIEKVLITHPQVTDVAVFAVPDQEWGEAVMAAVQTLPGTNGSPQLAAELIDFARERLAAYKLPRRIEFHDELPRTDSGKLYVRRLKERHWKDSGRRI